MKEFLYGLLINLDKLTGLQQYAKLRASKDHIKEINELLDVLCRVCNQFDYIPDQNKQDIISRNVLSDQEFIGLNGRILFKWFSKECGAYYKEPTQEIRLPEGVTEYIPVTGELRQKYLDEWMKSLNKLQESVSVKEYSGTKKKAALEELPILEGYQRPTDDDLLKKELHVQYLRENYDPLIIGKKKENWISESEWLKQNEV